MVSKSDKLLKLVRSNANEVAPIIIVENDGPKCEGKPVEFIGYANGYITVKRLDGSTFKVRADDVRVTDESANGNEAEKTDFIRIEGKDYRYQFIKAGSGKTATAAILLIKVQSKYEQN